jgi:7-cyano-7-deazaguanine synthase
MSKAIVVFSGGQDSTTVLFEAIADCGADNLVALTFDYGQRHRSEVRAAREIAALANVRHVVADARVLGELAISAQTSNAIDVAPDGGLNNLPTTFTPSRNLVFCTLASSYAISRGIDLLYLGVCQTDYSGYPDCRRVTIDALETAIRLGNDLPDFHILTPLMRLTKAETVQLAQQLGPKCLTALALSVTCYHGKRPGCGTCPACELRAKGFAEAGIADPSSGLNP